MKEKEIQNLELKYEGIKLEYQYVNNLKNERIKKLTEQLTRQKEIEEGKIKEKEDEIQFYKKEFKIAVKKMEEFEKENEMIKNSRWWKIREKISKIRGD